MAELAKLNEHENTRLAHCEAVIKRGLNTYVSVGLALMEINEARLYRGSHPTFEQYVRERWDCSRDYAYKLIRAAATAKSLRDVDPGLQSEPETEKQARPLTRVEPEVAAKAWEKAVEENGPQPTAEQVEQAVAEVEAELGGQPQPTRAEQSRKALTSSDSNEWYTPPEIIEAVRELFGGRIDLDPASSEVAQRTVKAERWIGLPEDGLAVPWGGRVFNNCPYGLNEERRSNQGVWLEYAEHQVRSGNAEAVAFLCNAHIGRPWFRSVWRYPLVLFNERIRFLRPDGTPGDQPTQGDVLVLLVEEYRGWEEAFVGVMKRFGVVSLPVEDGLVEVVA